MRKVKSGRSRIDFIIYGDVSLPLLCLAGTTANTTFADAFSGVHTTRIVAAFSGTVGWYARSRAHVLTVYGVAENK